MPFALYRRTFPPLVDRKLRALRTVRQDAIRDVERIGHRRGLIEYEGMVCAQRGVIGTCSIERVTTRPGLSCCWEKKPEGSEENVLKSHGRKIKEIRIRKGVYSTGASTRVLLKKSVVLSLACHLLLIEGVECAK